MEKKNKERCVVSYHLLVFLLVLALKDPTVSSSSSFSWAPQEDDKVDTLPGQESFNVSFAHYSGYVTVDPFSGRALFYWFFEAVEDPSSKPLVLWLQGGPGCSSIGYGMAEEIGPFHIKPDGKTLYLNPYAWNQAKDSLAFLEEWLKRFPEYEGRDFYITGESYAGHYIPQLAQAILWSQKWKLTKSINLKGIMAGNPLSDDFFDHLGAYQFIWTTGLISDQTYKLLNFFCHRDSFLKPSPACKRMQDIASQELGDIDIYSIYTPACTANETTSNGLLKRSHQLVGWLGKHYDPCTLNHSTVYFNTPEVQTALHVIPKFAPTKWLPCNHLVSGNWKDTATSVLDIYHELMFSGLRIWVFSGDTDTVIPVTSTRYWVDALNLPTVIPWHAWYDNGQVGGWTQVYKGLTYVTVRGAGHEVPKHKPRAALTLFSAFLSGTFLPTSTQTSDS
ncbi:serine carboxypeptidase II-2-like isoform X2 [Magnolia sinica]|uniref:serine carboxypeptidase II-2-like isoform X2 n=1 Tax=Magnolia sinica TaxID=86752 RepID=UPI0026581D07|nr:serine carboxypeptidase II-2-like isoform X2 [Magnolia sinica]